MEANILRRIGCLKKQVPQRPFFAHSMVLKEGATYWMSAEMKGTAVHQVATHAQDLQDNKNLL
jgi:hypothetical protein